VVVNVRPFDIVLVAKAFLHKPGLTFAPDALRALSLHRWPGNVRELQNRVQRAVANASPPVTWN
jgi:two-component system NtrC family response regulator